ncbi:TPA: ATP-binding cassette domain-containing protein [Escherichia coli]|uniref:ATP-binding cassette domain-containing protein n=1 Tax=Escherichia coli TaxID=562 RepID=UPI000E1DA91D|nr:ATP-binding cassette domain-containing protein [Escherichia coli]EEZ6201428.1 ATP-binding cassette domain-containing protein [Escherichia coli O8]EFN7279901.1 ATP-binding cassette domain-containing protein [Escherichia coli O11:H5]EHK5475566.1 ATP-binding cassette domain-containing protein [Escherichia coli]EHK6606351.1 ATP-binding cassette domain-containing protein [Escherichia coli]EHT4087946.1 ATP-binding cassette domain-containing protein [Escherichia coli]
MIDALKIYFEYCGETLSDLDLIDPIEIKECINNHIDNKLFEYQYVNKIFDNSNELFIFNSIEDKYIVVKKEIHGYYDLTNKRTLETEVFYGKEIFLFKKKPLITDDVDLFNKFISMTPRVGLWSLPLVLFALLSPFYSNIFNSRLVYSDSALSFFFISLIFVFLMILEMTIKSSIYEKTTEKIMQNNILCNLYWLDFLKYSRCRSFSIKIRAIDNALNYIWESFSIIITDFSLSLLYFTTLAFLLGKYVFIIFIYYLVVSVLLVYTRFKTYKRNLLLNATTYEKLGVNISLEANRDDLPFIPEYGLKSHLSDRFHHDEMNRITMQRENHHWSEVIRTNSFISMVVLYATCYFSIQYGEMQYSIIIALMIINSRLSAALIGVTNRIYMAKIQIYHLKENLHLLFQNRVNYITCGVHLDRINSFDIHNLTVSAGSSVLLANFSKTLTRGDCLGINGPSGCGKTTFIKTLLGLLPMSAGEIKVNNIHLTELDQLFIQNKFTYHSSDSRFIRGSLIDNFKMRGVDDNELIISIIRKCCPKLIISKENLSDKDAEDLLLSNGEKQKILLEMALSKKPDIIFLDESTSYLPSNEAFNVINDIKRRFPEAILIISTHDSSLLTLCNHTITLGKKSIMSGDLPGRKVINVSM